MYVYRPRVTGRTSSVVVRVSAKRKSPQVNRNVNRPAVTRAFLDMGSTTETSVRRGPAPSTQAASTTCAGIADMNARRMRIANGRPPGGAGGDSPPAEV